ncbi:hypothetical protein QWY86_05820 [Pedobacter aquatilis]|uniref:hypothetical protein n=1 Tax=Pedobacter aquatilis TaxID=351343 RepID=UPI0025B30E80|nr:hypothetical protein [Pedobacter aquatilis]MDN3586174.1 hypothetical protein [Pedobacter aquatilis]
MIRTGTILSFNKLAGVGILKDLNNQTIKYHAQNDKLLPLKGDVVSFDIGFHNNRLIATNLKLLNRAVVSNI